MLPDISQVMPAGLPSAAPAADGKIAVAAKDVLDLKFIASVVLRLDPPICVGETPDGVRIDLRAHGTLEGPRLKGRFPLCAAYLLIDPDGVGLIEMRAAVLLDDGAFLEWDATGRCDLGPDGYSRGINADLPRSPIAWCPRISTGHVRYSWLDRSQCLGVGEIRAVEARVSCDLFAIVPRGLRSTA